MGYIRQSTSSSCRQSLSCRSCRRSWGSRLQQCAEAGPDLYRGHGFRGEPGSVLHTSYSLHCSSFCWFNQWHIRNPIRYITPKRNYNGDYTAGCFLVRNEYELQGSFTNNIYNFNCSRVLCSMSVHKDTHLYLLIYFNHIGPRQRPKTYLFMLACRRLHPYPLTR